jgi:hypothetical protein
MRIPGRESARGRPRWTQAARTKLEAGSERKMESACADHHKCAGSKATAGETAGLVAWRRLTCVVSEVAGQTRAHAEARGDLHGRRHAYTLRPGRRNGTGHPPAAPSPCNRATCAFAAGGLLQFAHRTSENLVRCCAPALTRYRMLRAGVDQIPYVNDLLVEQPLFYAGRPHADLMDPAGLGNCQFRVWSAFGTGA